MTRVISGVILAAAVLAAILFLPFIALRVLVAVVAGLAACEYIRMTGRTNPEGRLHRSLFSRALVIAAVAYAAWWSAVPAPLSIVLLSLAVVAWLAIDVLREGRTLEQAAVDLVAPIYIGAPLGMLAALQMRSGPRATLLLIATIVISDSAQYYTGRAFGRHPLAPTISPKKTVEGALGGVLFGTLFMALAIPYVYPLTPPFVRIMLGAAVVMFGIVGDLFESRIKRLANLKDSSHVIPGHGGILDRIDALLFAIPVFYFMVVQGRVA
jgi:phosphatidate cytidylyltransferase